MSDHWIVPTEPLTEAERREGIAAGPFWVPFEKGDRSQEIANEDGTVTYLGARWTRENPLVIDWSKGSVRLLRARPRGSSSRRGGVPDGSGGERGSQDPRPQGPALGAGVLPQAARGVQRARQARGTVPAKVLAQRMGLADNVNLVHQRLFRTRRLESEGRLRPMSKRGRRR